MTTRSGTTRSGATTAPTYPGLEQRGRMPNVSGVVLAWAPRDVLGEDRAPLTAELTVGRSSRARWRIDDRRLSRTHFTLFPQNGGFALTDAGSRNGTLVDGEPVTGTVRVETGSVVRAGGCVFVVVDDMDALAPPGEPTDFGLAGRFHSRALVHALRVAARTERHVLLEGETGAGKELAAKALHEICAELGRGPAYRAENAACFAGDDDAVASIFGVAKGVFTGVGHRVGAIEQAKEGTVFLDEFHNLPARAQRSLLRFLEDGLFSRLGESSSCSLDVRLILGTNLPVDEAADDGRLAHDLVARLHRVRIPPLRQRRADVPSIFEAVLGRRAGAETTDSVMKKLRVENAERLCLPNYERGNVRELEQLAAVLVARLAEGEALDRAWPVSLDELIPPAAPGQMPVPPDEALASPSKYERHKDLIIETYRQVGGNLTHLESALRGQGIKCNRRWLASFLDKWEVRPIRRTSDD